MLLKIHKSYREVVAVCDSCLLNKRFEEGKMQIELGAFFDGEEKTEKEILEIMDSLKKEDASFNIVGKQSIECALKAGVIEKSGIIIIKGVPVALALL